MPSRELTRKNFPKIVLSGDPKSTSHIYHYTCSQGLPRGYMTTKGHEIKEAYQWEAKSQWKAPPIESELRVRATLFFGTKRKADVDNFNKLWLDALSGIVWLDDSQIVELTTRKGYDKEAPRIEVEVFL